MQYGVFQLFGRSYSESILEKTAKIARKYGVKHFKGEKKENNLNINLTVSLDEQSLVYHQHWLFDE